MIFKEKDPIEDQLQEMEHALRARPAAPDRNRLQKELAIRRAGANGEKEAAYHIDFYLRSRPNWAVIHDLRLEWNGRVAQIDHLLIDRLLEFYVIESKSFRTKIRFANGGWERLNFDQWEGILCPVEQNERHIAVLKELIKDNQLAPTRLGVSLQPSFFNVVVVQPSCSIVGKYPREVRIYRLDRLVKAIGNDNRQPWTLVKIVSQETLHAFARNLVANHRPAPELAVPMPQCHPTAKPVAAVSSAAQRCEGCGGVVSARESNYCRDNKPRFGGKILCRKCQVFAPEGNPRGVSTPAKPNAATTGVVARCAECGEGVEKKVVSYCRIKSKQFAGRVLCRNCQAKAANGIVAGAAGAGPSRMSGNGITA